MKNLKLSKLLVAVLSSFLLAVSCNKDEETNPQNSNIVSGIYSGVIVGSTGAYEAELTKNGATANILFDGTNYILSSNETLEKGQSITLTNGTISLTITVDNDGVNPTISFIIPGHDIEATISTTTNTNSETGNYVGSFKATNNSGLEFYKATYNLNLYDGNKFKIIEKIRLDNDSNGNSVTPNKVGKVNTINGTYSINSNVITFTFSSEGETVNISLNIIGNTLQDSDILSDGSSSETLLTKVQI